MLARNLQDELKELREWEGQDHPDSQGIREKLIEFKGILKRMTENTEKENEN